MILLYIDPGIGSAVIQALIAGTIGLLYGVKMFGHRIKAFFGRIWKKKEQD